MKYEALLQRKTFDGAMPGRGTIRIVSLAANTLRVIGAWRRRARERRVLGELNPHQLADIGLKPSDVWIETNKPAWRT